MNNEIRDLADITLSVILTGLETLRTLLMIADIKFMIKKEHLIEGQHKLIRDASMMVPAIRYEKTKNAIKEIFGGIEEIVLKIPGNEPIKFHRITFEQSHQISYI